MRRAALLVLFIAACPGLTPPESGCKPQPLNSETDTPLFEVGVPYRAVIGSGVLPHGCGEAGAHPTLVDEQNLAVSDAEWTFEVASSGEPIERLAFTPASGGPFHFAVQFEPSLTLRQGELYAGIRQPRAVLANLKVPADLTSCEWAHQMPGGTLLCVDASSRLRAIRDGGDVQVFEMGTRAVYAGDVAWVNGPLGKNLSRWVETPDGIARAQQSNAFRDVEVLAASRDFAYASEGSQVGRYRVQGTTLELDHFSVPHSLSSVRGDVIDTRAPGSLSADGGAWWWAADFACLNPIVPDGGQRCAVLPLLANFVEPGAVWFAANTLGYLDEAFATGSIGRPGGYLVRCGPLLSSGSQFAIAAVRDGGLRYELLEGDYQTGWLDGDRIYLLGSGTVTVLER